MIIVIGAGNRGKKGKGGYADDATINSQDMGSVNSYL
jgi:hypothetical protein